METKLLANMAEKYIDNEGCSQELIQSNFFQYSECMMMYSGAIREVKTKVLVLCDEFKVRSQRDPIEFIKDRIKSPKSILEKLQKRNLPLTIESMVKNLDDIAGIRVICSFIEDIYSVADMLLAQDDITLITKKDYIKNPKDNGYRSLHLIVEVPVFLSDRKQPMKVEVQIRTIAMDFWASLEHQIHYKKVDNASEDIINELKDCADIIYSTDLRMQNVAKKLEKCCDQKKTNINNQGK